MNRGLYNSVQNNTRVEMRETVEQVTRNAVRH